MSRIITFSIFLSMMVGVVAGLHYYFYARLIRDTAMPREWRTGLLALMVLLAVSLPAAMALTRTLPPPWRDFVSWPAFLWMGGMFLLFVLLLMADGTRVLSYLAGKAFSTLDLNAVDPARRLFLARVVAGGALLGSFGLSGVAVAGALSSPRIRRVRVPLKRWPKALDGFVIVQLTDIHVGPTLGRDYIQNVVTRTNAQNPDLIVITGDLVDGSVEDLSPALAPLKDLRAKHGVYFVTGNHEYYSGVDEWLVYLEQIGIRTLHNEHVILGDNDARFALAGVYDSTAHQVHPQHRVDVAAAVAGIAPELEVVLLAHQPREIDAAARQGVGLMLSGHTHGGQIWPFGMLVRLAQPYLEGLALHAGITYIYVSRGTGYWGPPMRLGVPSEITRVELSSQGEPSVSDVEGDTVRS